uniref:Uncharacterized protein n=1 Tax=Marseillevirus LCMAC101 TaxID=2506602 RepID=A0A481YR61_9VIRU|nr:MAG: hypothetical protein LCMAC101_02870 [Marseillevirus LCMAC101]
MRIVPHTNKIRGNNYTKVADCSFDLNDYSGELRRVKVLSYLDSGATSYDIEVFDRDNNVQLVETNFTNTSGEVQEQATGVISSPPSSKTVLEVNVKKTGGNGSHYARISEIVFYFAE